MISCRLFLKAYNARNIMLIDFIKELKKPPPLRAPKVEAESWAPPPEGAGSGSREPPGPARTGPPAFLGDRASAEGSPNKPGIPIAKSAANLS